jgi:sarcosine oxidase
MNPAVDMIVLGLGAMGSATAMHLADRGYRTRAFDQFAPPHDQGSSHGKSRIVRQAYFEDSRYVPLLLRAYELWRKLEHDVDQRLLHLTGALVIGPETGALVSRSAESARQFHLPHELLDYAELRRRYPVFELPSNTCALLEHNAGYLVPELCIEQQMKQAARNGAQLHLNEPVLEWRVEPGDAGVVVRTNRASYTAERLIITAGPWTPRILAEFDLPLRVTRQILFWFEPKASIEGFRDDRLPVYLLEPDGEQPLLYGFPLTGAESEGVKVALHGSEEVCTPESVWREVRPQDEQSIRERLENTLPSLAGRLLRAETCLYTMTPDEHFLISAHPQHANVTLAAGFSGHGFKFAPVIGEVLADLATVGKSSYDLGLFSLDRKLDLPHGWRQ